MPKDTQRGDLAMKRWILLLKIFGFVCIALAFSMVIAGLQPFNLKNYVITLAAFSPAFAAFIIARLLENRGQGKDS